VLGKSAAAQRAEMTVNRTGPAWSETTLAHMRNNLQSVRSSVGDCSRIGSLSGPTATLASHLAMPSGVEALKQSATFESSYAAGPSCDEFSNRDARTPRRQPGPA
jgi:hypothetical protein